MRKVRKSPGLNMCRKAISKNCFWIDSMLGLIRIPYQACMLKDRPYNSNRVLDNKIILKFILLIIVYLALLVIKNIWKLIYDIWISLLLLINKLTRSALLTVLAVTFPLRSVAKTLRNALARIWAGVAPRSKREFYPLKHES